MPDYINVTLLCCKSTGAEIAADLCHNSVKIKILQGFRAGSVFFENRFFDSQYILILADAKSDKTCIDQAFALRTF